MILNLFIAFAGGFISFLSPCVLPLIPGYIAYISGGTLNLPANKIIVKQTKWIGVQHYNPWIIESALQFLSRTKKVFPLNLKEILSVRLISPPDDNL